MATRPRKMFLLTSHGETLCSRPVHENIPSPANNFTVLSTWISTKMPVKVSSELLCLFFFHLPVMIFNSLKSLFILVVAHSCCFQYGGGAPCFKECRKVSFQVKETYCHIPHARLKKDVVLLIVTIIMIIIKVLQVLRNVLRPKYSSAVITFVKGNHLHSNSLHNYT